MIAKYRPLTVIVIKWDHNINEMISFSKNLSPDCHIFTAFEWDYVIVRRGNVCEVASLGDYIVMNSRGEPFVYTQREFYTIFEPMDEEPPKPESTYICHDFDPEAGGII